MSQDGSQLFIVDNSATDWKVRSYLSEWCDLSRAIDIATGYFEIGALLALDGKWQGVERIRILMGDEVSMRTKNAFVAGLAKVVERLDRSVEGEKPRNDFLQGVPAIVEALRSKRILCKIYRKDKFHAKAYLTHARAAVVGSFGLVGSPSRRTSPSSLWPRTTHWHTLRATLPRWKASRRAGNAVSSGSFGCSS